MNAIPPASIYLIGFGATAGALLGSVLIGLMVVFAILLIVEAVGGYAN
jgi:hypothetical protein